MSDLKQIKLIILDVDGTLTDGKIYYDSQGNEVKAFNAKDGMAIAQATSRGIEFGIITGRNSSIVERRAYELGIKYLYQGIHNKVEVAEALILKMGITYEEVMYIGDDINDLAIMSKVGWKACPQDAAEEVVECCDIISKYTGGNGAVREIVENVLKSQGKWNEIVTKYRGLKQ